jgi:hypothetical protein
MNLFTERVHPTMGNVNQRQDLRGASAPLTESGAFCQAVPGNQCCNGLPGNFVGVKVEDQSLVCLSNGVCRAPGTPCALDSDCGGSLVCMRGADNCGCAGATPTYCGTPAAPP